MTIMYMPWQTAGKVNMLYLIEIFEIFSDFFL